MYTDAHTFQHYANMNMNIYKWCTMNIVRCAECRWMDLIHLKSKNINWKFTTEPCMHLCKKEEKINKKNSRKHIGHGNIGLAYLFNNVGKWWKIPTNIFIGFCFVVGFALSSDTHRFHYIYLVKFGWSMRRIRVCWLVCMILPKSTFLLWWNSLDSFPDVVGRLLQKNILIFFFSLYYLHLLVCATKCRLFDALFKSWFT